MLISRIRDQTSPVQLQGEFHHGADVVALSDPLQARSMPTYCADEGEL